MIRPALVAIFLCAGCDPGWKIAGVVVDASDWPITDASVALACPGGGTGAGPVPQTFMTTADGRFFFSGVSGAANAGKCTLTISKPGLTTKTVSALDVCYRSTKTRNFTTQCAPSEGHVTLTP